MAANETFTQKAWTRLTRRKFSLRAWQEETGYRIFTLKGWTEFVRGLGRFGGPSPEGPLDLVPGAALAFGNRALSTARFGENVYTIRRDSDDAEQAFAAAGDGSVPVADILAFIGAGSGFITQWNDQSGNVQNLAQANINLQPQWTDVGIDNRPGIQSMARILATPDISFPGGEFTLILCLVMTDIEAGAPIFATRADAKITDYFQLASFWNAEGDLYFSNTSTDPDTVWATSELLANDTGYVFEFVIAADGTMSAFSNGVPFTLVLERGTPAPLAAKVMDFRFPSNNANGYSALEKLVYFSALSPGDRASIRQNIADYYGITLAP